MLGKIKLGISIGDPNGVGIEIILKIFEDRRLFEFFTPLIFGPIRLLENQKKHFNLNSSLTLKKNNQRLNKAQLNVFDLPMPAGSLVFGEASKTAGSIAFESLKSATKALKEGEIDALVTAPINKDTIQSKDFEFSGHTDYLAKQLDGKSLMFMISETLKVALVSDHIAIKEISGLLSTDLLREKIHYLESALQHDFKIIRPRIAVLGLNPHSGDKGVIGKEDDQIIRPLIEELSALGHLVYGPYAADSFFGNQTYIQFDAVLAIYHDQGLIPFKTLTFGTGVNFTAGLSKVRTSPDHGTAFEIAGKGEAKTESFRNAMLLARNIFFCRQDRKNPTIESKDEK
ncbi:MAG: 4-hydroxythreonine-4-phosphate dehydrogenase PdxA [Flavobacteriaceae bacterium]